MNPLEAGSDYVTDDYSLSDFEKAHNAFVLGIASGDCLNCGDAEDMLDKLFKLSLMGDILYKNKTIPVVRIDSNKYQSMLERSRLPTTPGPHIYLFYKKHYYAYSKGYHLNFFINFINRHLYPVVILKSIEDVDEFRNVTAEWRENTPLYTGRYRSIKDIFPDMTKVTRIIAFIAHKSEYSYELKELNKIAKDFGFRDDLRIAKVTDLDIIKHYKFKLQMKWFDQSSVNSLVAFTKGKNPVQYYDLSVENYDLKLWMNAASVDALELITPMSLPILDNMDMPIFTAFVNTVHPKYALESEQLLQILNETIPEYPQYLFGYFNDDSFNDKKTSLGITWDSLPSLALYNPPSEGAVVFPQNIPITKKNLKAFLDKGVSSVINSEPIRYPDDSYDMDKNLRYVSRLAPENYTEALASDRDIAVLIFNPTLDYEEISITTENFGMSCKLISDLKVKSVDFMYFDTHQYELPSDLQYHDTLPYILFKTSEGELYVKFEDFDPTQTMLFLRDTAGVKFKFPDHPKLNKKAKKSSYKKIDNVIWNKKEDLQI